MGPVLKPPKQAHLWPCAARQKASQPGQRRASITVEAHGRAGGCGHRPHQGHAAPGHAGRERRVRVRRRLRGDQEGRRMLAAAPEQRRGRVGRRWRRRGAAPAVGRAAAAARARPRRAQWPCAQAHRGVSPREPACKSANARALPHARRPGTQALRYERRRARGWAGRPRPRGEPPAGACGVPGCGCASRAPARRGPAPAAALPPPPLPQAGASPPLGGAGPMAMTLRRASASALVSPGGQAPSACQLACARAAPPSSAHMVLDSTPFPGRSQSWWHSGARRRRTAADMLVEGLQQRGGRRCGCKISAAAIKCIGACKAAPSQRAPWEGGW